MGTTCVLLVIDKERDTALMAHVGDSRGYLLRGSVLKQLTRDHTMVQRLVDDGIIPPEAARIMCLRDGSAKMSKSDPSDMSRINLTDDANTIMGKVKKAKTDPEPLPSDKAGLEGRAEAANLVGIYAAMAGASVDAVLAEFGGKGFGAFKPALGELMVERLAPINTRFNELRQDRAALDAILRQGAEKARAMAVPTLDAAYAALGLVRG